MQTDPHSLTGNWTFPTAIRFGPGRISELAEACRALGMRRPLLVTDPGLRGSAMVGEAAAATVRDGLPTALFSDLQPNPLDGNIADGVSAYRAGGHDGIIGFGGGSALDTAKAVAFMSAQTRPIADFEDIGDNWRRARTGGIPPVIAVPTTAGTGSEVGRAAVVADAADGRKKVIFHPAMMPDMVIADPALTLTLPPEITAATGMDALIHCLEAYCAPGFHPLADGVAVEGFRLAAEWLPMAYAYGAEMPARAHMMAAAMMGAVAFQKGLGAVHSLSHAVGSLYATHHGLTNAVILPYVLRFNRPAIEDKCRLLGWVLGLEKPEYSSVFKILKNLRSTLNIPDTLAALGVDAARADRVAALAYDDPTRPGNPVPVSEDDLREIFLAAVRGPS